MAEKEMAGRDEEAFRSMCGPNQIDQMVRQAISFCWMMAPKEKKNIEFVEAEIRRVVERALRNLKEDADAFGVGGPK
jgi:hypothetical protein